jgi:hypothetical protein
MQSGVRKSLGLISMISVVALLACSHTQTTEIADLQEQVREKDGQIQDLEASNQEKAVTIAKYQKQMGQPTQATMRAPIVEGESALLPPNAQPGECYARVFVPPTYTTRTERVLKTAASERLEIVPARYEWVEEQVLVQEASQRMEVVPAAYDWVEERVLVQEASTELTQVPAQYEWQEERMLVKPAHTVWKKGRGPIERVDNITGEIMCLIEVPATYKTVKKRVMTTPPNTRTVEIPAKYDVVRKQVMVKPPEQRVIEIPAKYKTVKIRKQVSPPQERKIDIPAEYESVTKTEIAQEGRMEWRRILCETNMTPDKITRIQSALLNAGYNPGPIDGEIGWRTQSAFRAYQRDNNLAEGDLTYETIKKLGVEL